jgi:predicted phosphate transport protein (TIGR00153 family)
MQIFKKEKHVVKLVLEHIDKTAECVQTMTDNVRAFVSGNYSAAEIAASRINSFESDADTLLRSIRELLYSGAYLPHIRGDIYRLMSRVDDVANKAEDCHDFFHYQKPDIAEEYRSQIAAILELTSGCFLEFQKALQAYFDPKGDIDTVRAHTRKVSELESLIDDNEQALTAQIFDSSLEKSDKIHLRQCLTQIVTISDTIEDAADELELAGVKAIV